MQVKRVKISSHIPSDNERIDEVHGKCEMSVTMTLMTVTSSHSPLKLSTD